MAGKISPLCKWNGMFLLRSVATKKVEQLRRLSVCSGKFPLEPRVPFAFQPVEPEILAKWKAPQVIDLQTIYSLLCEDDEGAILSIPRDFDLKLFLMDITIREPLSDFARQQNEQIEKLMNDHLDFNGSDLVEQSGTNRFGRKSQQP